MTRTGSPAEVVLRAALLGVVAGMRSQLPFALLALAARRDEGAAAGDGLARVLRSKRAAVGFGLSVVGELVGDKLPVTPSRLDPLPLAGRVVFGGVAGAVLAREAGGNPSLGAVAGGAGSLLGAFGGYQARVALGRATGVPDPVWGAVEDAVAVSLGLLAVRR